MPPPRPQAPQVIEIRPAGAKGAGGPGYRDSEALERRIGSQWLNRVGIFAVLIGVAYFLKLAVDSAWIKPAAWVVIGLFAGIALVWWSERFRRLEYVLFSYSLKAVGFGMLYLALWASVYLYALVPVSVAFAGMVLVTATAAWLALRQNAEVLAGMALAGGFLTPLVLWLQKNHDLDLFAYIILLDLATFWMAATRGWRRLLLGSFIGSSIVYAAWYFTYFQRPQIVSAAIFVSVLWVIFAVTPLFVPESEVHALSVGSRAILVLALFNAGVCFVELYTMLEFSAEHDWTGWAALLLAVSYLLLGWLLQAKYHTAETSLLPWLHVGVAAGFLTIFIALKFESQWISFGWLTEAAALYWLAMRAESHDAATPRRSQANLLAWFAVAALLLALSRVLITSDQERYTLLFNQRFAAYAYAIAVLIFMGWWTSRRRGTASNESSIVVAVILVNLLALLAFHFELRDYFDRLATTAANMAAYTRQSAAPELRRLAIVRSFSYSAVWMVYGALLMVAGFWKRWSLLRWQAIVLIGITIVKVFTYDVSALDREYRIASFIALGVILLAISFLYQRDWLKLQKAE